jgi:hypothetical protein
MDARRLNDTLKLVGATIAGVAIFGPVLMRQHATLAELIGDLLTQFPGALSAFAAGMGTRGFGLEYKDVAEAKAMAKVASLAPPPNLDLSERPTRPSIPPVKP